MPSSQLTRRTRLIAVAMVRCCKWVLARSAQVKGPHPLRNGRLNPSSQSILLLEGFSLLKLACCLERGMLRLWSDDHRSAWIFAGGLNAIGKTRARLAISGGKLDLDQFRMRLP